MTENTIKLSEEELDILKSYESGEWGTVAEIEA